MIPRNSKRLDGDRGGLNQRQMRSRYWSVVRECLIEFHQFTKTEARGEAASLRKRIEASESDGLEAAIYHDEPYFVACDIAGIHDSREQSDRLERDWPAYDRLFQP